MVRSEILRMGSRAFFWKPLLRFSWCHSWKSRLHFKKNTIFVPYHARPGTRQIKKHVWDLFTMEDFVHIYIYHEVSLNHVGFNHHNSIYHNYFVHHVLSSSITIGDCQLLYSLSGVCRLLPARAASWYLLESPHPSRHTWACARCGQKWWVGKTEDLGGESQQWSPSSFVRNPSSLKTHWACCA